MASPSRPVPSWASAASPALLLAPSPRLAQVAAERAQSLQPAEGAEAEVEARPRRRVPEAARPLRQEAGAAALIPRPVEAAGVMALLRSRQAEARPPQPAAEAVVAPLHPQPASRQRVEVEAEAARRPRSVQPNLSWTTRRMRQRLGQEQAGP